MEFNCRGIVVLIKWRRISFHSWKPYRHIAVLAISIGDLQFSYLYQRLLDRPPFEKELHRVLCLIFRIDWFQRKPFFIFPISPMICCGITDVKYKWTILDKAKVFWERFECLILMLRNFFPCQAYYCMKNEFRKNLVVFIFKLTHFIPQTATLTPFRDPNPAISHLEKFGLRPEYFK